MGNLPKLNQIGSDNFWKNALLHFLTLCPLFNANFHNSLNFVFCTKWTRTLKLIIPVGEFPMYKMLALTLKLTLTLKKYFRVTVKIVSIVLAITLNIGQFWHERDRGLVVDNVGSI